MTRSQQILENNRLHIPGGLSSLNRLTDPPFTAALVLSALASGSLEKTAGSSIRRPCNFVTGKPSLSRRGDCADPCAGQAALTRRPHSGHRTALACTGPVPRSVIRVAAKRSSP